MVDFEADGVGLLAGRGGGVAGEERGELGVDLFDEKG